MNYIVTLYLNEIGRKALGVDEKTITIDVETKDNLSNEIIDKVFPISLVKSYDIKSSFANNPVGSYVAVVKDGVRYLGEILDQNWYNYIFVRLHLYEPEVTYTKTLMFHPNGVEVTNKKNKYHLENISNDEVETIKETLKNKPFSNMLNMLVKNSKVNIDEIRIPEWLNTETVKKITEMLNNDYDEYYYG